MAYLVRHTLNQNKNYTSGKQNTLPFGKKSCHWYTTAQEELTVKQSTVFFITKCAYYGREPSICWPKKLHNDFFLKMILKDE